MRLDIPTQEEIQDIMNTQDPEKMKTLEGLILQTIYKVRKFMSRPGYDPKYSTIEAHLSESLGKLMVYRQRIELVLSNHS